MGGGSTSPLSPFRRQADPGTLPLVPPFGLPSAPPPLVLSCLHVPPDAEEEAEVHAHGPDVGPRLTADPEDRQVPLLVKRVEPEG